MMDLHSRTLSSSSSSFAFLLAYSPTHSSSSLLGRSIYIYIYYIPMLVLAHGPVFSVPCVVDWDGLGVPYHTSGAQHNGPSCCWVETDPMVTSCSRNTGLCHWKAKTEKFVQWSLCCLKWNPWYNWCCQMGNIGSWSGVLDWYADHSTERKVKQIEIGHFIDL